jgi:hypothetical protein
MEALQLMIQAMEQFIDNFYEDTSAISMRPVSVDYARLQSRLNEIASDYDQSLAYVKGLMLEKARSLMRGESI